MHQGTTKPHNPSGLQTLFLESLMVARTQISCYLVNGVRLGGSIKAIDRHTIFITPTRGGTPTQMVYKSSISSIGPVVTDTRIQQR